jgi:diadenosine tetraphosphate (Ap4A) HIT family hydrolase
MSSSCPFCEKLNALTNVADAELVWSFPHSVALLGTWQFYRGYCVLVCRRHATELSQLSAEDRRGYLDEMCLLARAIEVCRKPHKLNYELLGNQVPHLHWHLFPRYLDDPDRLRPVWLALDAAERDPVRRQALEGGSAERSATSADLRQALQQLGAPRA